MTIESYLPTEISTAHCLRSLEAAACCETRAKGALNRPSSTASPGIDHQATNAVPTNQIDLFPRA
jgi:hypothetical protein